MRACLFSVSYAGLWGQHRLDLCQFLERAAGIGYPAVELMAKRPHLSPLDWSEAALLSLKRKADELGTEIATRLHGFYRLCCRRSPLYEMQLQYVRSVVDMASSVAHRARFTGLQPMKAC